MEIFKVINWNCNSLCTRLNHLAKILVLVVVVVSATGASATPLLSRISCGRNSFNTAGTDACSVYLTSPTSGKLRVTLASNNPAVTVPSTVTVRAGRTTTGFNATVAAVTLAQTAIISAQAGGITSTFVIALSPPAGTPALTVSTPSVSFGNVAVGTTATATVAVTASGSAPLMISSISVTGSLFGARGIVAPVTLNPGQTAYMTVTFSPNQPSPGYNYTGLVTIASNAPSATVNLAGTGVAASSTVSAVFCNSISITGSLADACTVSLSGLAPAAGLNVGLASSSSAVTVPSSVTVPAGASSATFIAHMASVSTSQAVTLTATTGSTSRTLSLQLNAANPVLSLNASSISFGAIVVNNATTQTVTLTSSGTAAVTVNSVIVSGSGFSISPLSLPATLNPGQTMNVSLTFDPTAVGAATGTMTVTSNSSTNATATVSLSGTGNPHQVALSWNAPSGSTNPIAGYNVYRAAGGTTAFAVMNSMDAQTAYTDANVQSGQNYTYYVTSVDSTGLESLPSNTTTARIP